jgi:hypothetical protein
MPLIAASKAAIATAADGTSTRPGSGSEERLDDGTLGRTISGGQPSEYVPISDGQFAQRRLLI